MKKVLTLAVLGLMAISTTVAFAGYDISAKNITDVTTITNTDVVSTDYLHVYRTGSTDAAKISAESLGTLTFLEDTTAANTLAASECGKTILINSASGFATTLPTPTSGCSFKFVVKTVNTDATNHTIVTDSGANIMIGGINELEVDTNDDGPYQADADTITFNSSAAVAGDLVNIFSDGTSWYFDGQTNADGGISLSSS